ncbi:MAG: epoxyqueuosine reductase QueH [Deltaproteobacteria bacterium]|nr:epoxyqueuosine reductase QueH [Deltaproteobacteria bacterium]
MKLLLHVCCAPCSTVAVERLVEAGHSVTLFFFNPNIFPAEELEHRIAEARALAAKFGVELVAGPEERSRWRRAVEPLAARGERSIRCNVCFAVRLDAAAREARLRRCDAFTTTLSTAPMKDSKTIFRIGRMLGRKHGVAFLEEDFKKRDGLHRSSVLCRKHGLYRQDYCGCEWSLAERREARGVRREEG